MEAHCGVCASLCTAGVSGTRASQRRVEVMTPRQASTMALFFLINYPARNSKLRLTKHLNMANLRLCMFAGLLVIHIFDNDRHQMHSARRVLPQHTPTPRSNASTRKVVAFALSIGHVLRCGVPSHSGSVPLYLQLWKKKTWM